MLNISHWFNNSKLSINTDKKKFALFHQVRQWENIPLAITTLQKQWCYKASGSYQVLSCRIRRKCKLKKSYKFDREQKIKNQKYITSNQIYVKKIVFFVYAHLYQLW